MTFSDLLNKPFSELTKAQFLNFLQNQFLKGFFTPVFDKDNVVANYVSKLQFIKQVNILGSADDLEDLIVLEIIKQNKGDSRVGLTSEIFKLISNNDFLNKPRFNVLAIVRSEKEPEQWRLSLVTSEGKTRSNPRRFSFILGVNEKVRTPKQQLIDLGSVTSWDDLKERFNVEVVRKEFFKLYINLFLEVYDAIITNDIFDGIIKKKEVEPISFAKNLMGKIVFLHFIQKKGWLGITDKNGKFGEGDHKFFKKNLDKLTANGDLFNKRTNFYNDFLEPLFYDGLNKEHENDRNETLQMKIPYLNGGLFQEEYDWKHTTIDLDNDIFKAIIEAFDVYNFTIDEGDIYDREIAVDPEMLGKLFESMIGFNIDNQEDVDRILNEYKEAKKKKNIKVPSPEHIIDLNLGKDKNKKLGAFYTPREIVGYMTRESIIEYLTSKLGEDSRNTIKQLFKYKDEYLSKQEIEAKANEIDNQLNSLETRITYTSLKHDVFDIIEFLNDVKVLDPAVGSGAFPMGILQELVSLKEYLINVFGLEKKSTYEIKREIIQNNIFGVDIDPGAISIARLRFWLGLVVDEEEPEPLPNLDFKFICANTLIPLSEKRNDDQDEFTKDANMETLRKYKKEYYDESDKTKKQQLAERIRNYRSESNNLFLSISSLRTQQITEFLRNFNNPEHIHSFFDPKLMFSEGNGFDIVIGNPPYINIYDIDENLKPVYQSLFNTAYQKYDMYVLFYEKGLSLLKKGGHINYITSNKFLSQGYGFELRKLFLKNTIKLMVNFNYDIFDNATVRTLILLCEKKETKDNVINIIDINTKDEAYKFNNLIYSQIKQSIFENTDQNNFRLNLTTRKIELLNKIKDSSVLLEDICSVNYGLRPSSEKLKLKKEAFIYDYDKGGLKQYFEGKDMGYWLVKKISFLDYKPNVMYNPMFPELFEYDKLVGLRTLSDIFKLRFIFDNKGFYCNDSTVVLTLRYLFEKVKYQTVRTRISDERINNSKEYKYQYLQAILNSKLIKFYVNELLYDGTHFYPDHMKQLPIKYTDNQNDFVETVNKIYNICKSNGYDFEKPTIEQINLEKQLDEMVYRLYGLTEEEIKIVEDSIKL